MRKSVKISVCTYNRPNQLREAIRAIGELVLPKDLDVSLLVVDNAPSDKVRTVFNEESIQLSIPSEYVEEPRRGIVHARNKALEVASESDTDFIAFFDDDDFPDPKWIGNLWDCYNTYNATVVFGKMHYIWPDSIELEDDIKRLYDDPTPNLKTGDVSVRCGTCNAFVNFQFVKNHDLKFNELLNLTGGEDTHFFESMTRCGAKIVYSAESVVHSKVVEERATRDFILSRRYIVGYVRFKIDALLHGRSKALKLNLYQLLKGSKRIVLDAIKGKSHTAQHQRRIAELKGTFHAVLGRRYIGYESTDGQ